VHHELTSVEVCTISEEEEEEESYRYLLECLKSQGLPTLHCFPFSCYFSYVIPAWGCFIISDLIANIYALLRTAVSWGYSCELKCLPDLLYDADKKPFRRMAAIVSY